MSRNVEALSEVLLGCCHPVWPDGSLDTEALAEELAANGVRVDSPTLEVKLGDGGLAPVSLGISEAERANLMAELEAAGYECREFTLTDPGALIVPGDDLMLRGVLVIGRCATGEPE